MNRRSFVSASALVLAQRLLGTPAAPSQTSATPSSTELATRLAHDPLRPRYHLLPQAGFVGDPCAPRFFRGHHHVFFHGTFGGRGWQHAMSADLVHWTHLPIALSPTENSPDSYGTFTGGVLPGGDGASIVYTGVTRVPHDRETIRAEGLREVQCIATSTDDDLRTWKKQDKPVIDGPPPGLRVTGFRDPFGWKDGSTWYILVGSGFPQVGGAVLLYRSTDMQHWEYLHPLAEGTWNGQSFSNPVPSGEMWECPDFFALGDKHVLLYSTEHTTRWEVGTFEKQGLRFHSERKGVLDQGAFYAPRSSEDGNGRRLLWGWVQETRLREDIDAAGWSGSISLPRVLTLGPDNALHMEVAPEFAALRQNTVLLGKPLTAADLSAGLSRAILRTRAGVITCRFTTGDFECALEVHWKSGSSTDTLLKLSYLRANGSPFVAVGDRLIPLSPDPAGVSTLEIWMDGSIFETFFDKRQAITTRSYAGPAETGEMSVVWDGPFDALESLAMSEMKSI